MMKKMSLPEASAAPAVVTPSTPSAAPSAAKGVFARAVTVDEQSDCRSRRRHSSRDWRRLGPEGSATRPGLKNSIPRSTSTALTRRTRPAKRPARVCARPRAQRTRFEPARAGARPYSPQFKPRGGAALHSVEAVRGSGTRSDEDKGRRTAPHYMRPCAMSTRMPCCPSRISRRNEATAIQTTG